MGNVTVQNAAGGGTAILEVYEGTGNPWLAEIMASIVREFHSKKKAEESNISKRERHRFTVVRPETGLS